MYLYSIDYDNYGIVIADGDVDGNDVAQSDDSYDEYIYRSSIDCKDVSSPICLLDRHSGSVVERPLCDREVAGSIPGQVIPKTFKMVLAALSLGAQH